MNEIIGTGKATFLTPLTQEWAVNQDFEIIRRFEQH
jgi:hypothetical protein